MKARVWAARLFLSTFLQHYKWPGPVFKTPATPPEHLCAPALADIYIHTSEVVLEGISVCFCFFERTFQPQRCNSAMLCCFHPQLRCYCLRTISTLMTLLSIRQAGKQKSSVFYCCALSFGESPIVPLNNWDQRICLLYFFSPWSATKLLVLSPRSIASVTRPERKRRRGARERGRERKGENGEREWDLCPQWRL